LDVVDTQLHLGRGKIDATLEAMDAVGITSVLIDEYWGGWTAENPPHIQPGFKLPNGAWRAQTPTSEEAANLHPDRFAYLVRVDREDPDLACVMRLAGSAPHARAVRIQPAWTVDEARAFGEGAYDELFALAQRYALPVFMFIPGYVELTPRYLAKHPELTLIVDHCGMGFPQAARERPAAERERVLSAAYFDEVLRLADYPNACLKWAHAQERFGAHDYPYEPLRPLLRRALDAFGADRVMWASDSTTVPGHSWSDLLHAVRDDPGLSADEKAGVLGRTARRVLDWPAADASD
jgi:predicted TIM-barrel fold metal-dependent hydrolase